jgi:hypothetical protein
MKTEKMMKEKETNLLTFLVSLTMLVKIRKEVNELSGKPARRNTMRVW